MLKHALRYIFVPIIFSFLLVACGGGGGGNSIFQATPTSNRLFVFDRSFSALASLNSANPAEGIFSLDTIISGTNSNFTNVEDIELDIENDRLYVTNGSSILVFDNVSTSNGNVGPSRIISSPSLRSAGNLYLDVVMDELYVTDDLIGIWVFENASIANGNVTPSRRLNNSFGATSFSIEGITIDWARNQLYVSVRGLSPSFEQIQVFNNVSSINGDELEANRVFSSNSMGGNPGQIKYDEINDRLFMSDSGSYGVRVFDNASTLSDVVSPDRTIYLGASITDIKVDFQNDRLYALNPSLLYIVENASTANGRVVVKILQSGNTFVGLDAIAVAP